VRGGKLNGSAGTDKTEKPKVFTPEQANALLDKVKNPKYHMLFMLAVFSGAREGELLGLKWKLACPENELVFPTNAVNPINYSNIMRCHFISALEAGG
jgi:hypothetical protein